MGSEAAGAPVGYPDRLVLGLMSVCVYPHGSNVSFHELPINYAPPAVQIDHWTDPTG